MKDKRETLAKLGFIAIFVVIIIAVLVPLLGALNGDKDVKDSAATKVVDTSAYSATTGTGGAASNETGSVSSTGTSEGIKVTFVELGSVKCIPCKMMQPIMKEIEEEYAGQVKVVFHDVWTEEGKPAAVQYAIRVIPTQVFLDASGKEYFRHEGFFPKEELVKVLAKQGVK